MSPRLLAGVLVVLAFAANAVAQDTDKPATAAPQIKVMSYNIHYAVGMDGKTSLARIAQVITGSGADIVGLQEIGSEVMARELGKLTKMQFVFGASKGKKNQYGDAILSRHPFTWVGNHAIPSASSSRYQAMAVDVDVSAVFGKGRRVRFVNTHFDWLDTLGSQEARLAAVAVVERAFCKDCKLPVILTGDLNATPKSPPLVRLAEKGWHYTDLGKPRPTIGTPKPDRQIDYVLVRPEKAWRVTAMQVLPEMVASDHLPIVTTLELLGS